VAALSAREARSAQAVFHAITGGLYVYLIIYTVLTFFSCIFHPPNGGNMNIQLAARFIRAIIQSNARRMTGKATVVMMAALFLMGLRRQPTREIGARAGRRDG
jgi:hypothetical protein